MYEDDTLTPDEEKRIQAAIAGCTMTETIYNLVTGKEKPTKKVAAAKQPAKKVQKSLKEVTAERSARKNTTKKSKIK